MWIVGANGMAVYWDKEPLKVFHSEEQTLLQIGEHPPLLYKGEFPKEILMEVMAARYKKEFDIFFLFPRGV